MSKSRIEWTEHSWNPLKVRDGGPFGCTKISPGCLNCYASSMNHRFGGKAFDYTRQPKDFYIDEKVLRQPFRAKKRHVYFVCSMTDLFHHNVSDVENAKVLEQMRSCPQHTFQVLTKRTDNMSTALNIFYNDRQMTTPLSNVWIGTTVENQEVAGFRIHMLKKCPAAIRWLSVEPMIGPIQHDLTGIDWVVIGAESGHGRRECKLEWVRDIVAQSKAASIPVFVKQLQLNGKLTKDINDFPDDLKIREFPDGDRKGK